MTKLGRQLDEIVDLLRSHLHGTVLEVQDGESLVYAASPRLRAGGKDSLHEGLVGLDVVFDKSRLGSDLEELVELKHPDSFDVDWSAQLVGLVVAVRVELPDLRKLVEHEGFDVVNIVFLPPFNEVCEHGLRFREIEFPRPQEAQQVRIVIWRILKAHLGHNHPELL